MAEYISRADIVKWLTAADAQKAVREMDGCSAYNWFLELVGFASAADVEPVRHGQWGRKQGGFWEFAACSLCGEKTPTVGITPNYCPNCGAKMDSEGEDK